MDLKICKTGKRICETGNVSSRTQNSFAVSYKE